MINYNTLDKYKPHKGLIDRINMLENNWNRHRIIKINMIYFQQDIPRV